MSKQTKPTCPVHGKELTCRSCLASKAAKAMHKEHGNFVGAVHKTEKKTPRKSARKKAA